VGLGTKLVGAAGAAAAMSVLATGTAGAGPPGENHRVDETHEFTLPGTSTSCTINLFTDIWDDGGDGGLGYTATRIREPQGDDDPCLAPCGWTSRSFRVQHTVAFLACDGTVTDNTSPK
jgi:hypothetical protein